MTVHKQATIAVDLDGTLAKADDKPFAPDRIGEPVRKMMARIHQYLEKGEKVVVFTARAADKDNIPHVKKWLKKHGLPDLEVTNQKTPDIEKFYDDRAVSVEKNTGKIKEAEHVTTHTVSMPGGQTVDVAELFKKTQHLPEVTVPIETLKGFNRSKRSGFSTKRYADADLRYPVLISESNLVMDGRHRIYKTLDGGKTKIQARIVPDALWKTAALMGVELKPHQQRLVNKLLQPDTTGVLAEHNMGSGKTLSSIAAWDALGRPRTAVVVPAALQENYRKELKKWVGEVPPEIQILSQQRLARNKKLDGPHPEFLVVDEQHKARDQESALRAALAGIQAKKKLLLTGTPIYNHPSDIAATVNLAAGKQVLPTDKTQFEQKYVQSRKVQPPLLQRLRGVKPGEVKELKNTRELQKTLARYVDYHPAAAEGFPRSSEETIKVPMSKEQTDIYKAIMGQAPRWLRWKIKMGMPPGKGELEAMRAFLIGARQVSNTSREFQKGPEQAAKIDAAFKYLQKQVKKDPSYKALVYSNFINSGLRPYRDRLVRAGIPFGEFSGQMGKAERDQMLRDYNANKLNALLLSSAAAEGLDTKATSLIQLLEPHFNEEKEKQIIGRGIRYQSHAGLPPEKQHVLVQRYLAQPRAGLLDRLLGGNVTRGADEYIRDRAIEKARLNNQVKQLLTGQRR